MNAKASDVRCLRLGRDGPAGSVSKLMSKLCPVCEEDRHPRTYDICVHRIPVFVSQPPVPDHIRQRYARRSLDDLGTAARAHVRVTAVMVPFCLPRVVFVSSLSTSATRSSLPDWKPVSFSASSRCDGHD